MAAVLVPAVARARAAAGPDAEFVFRIPRYASSQMSRYEYRIYGAGIPHRPYVSDTRNSCSVAIHSGRDMGRD
jgi:hypothetical protein